MTGRVVSAFAESNLHKFSSLTGDMKRRVHRILSNLLGHSVRFFGPFYLESFKDVGHDNVDGKDSDLCGGG